MSRIPFRTRARTVDHLGREQIADCPTAVSELWKNAYDAYARHVSLHIFDGEIPVAAIVDDGHGMSQEDFIDRWLMLGTDSKVSSSASPEADRGGLPIRPRQGLKGIGRLSVAYLGPTVLVLSRRRGHPFVAAAVDWRLFQNPYLNLDDVRVPVETFQDPADLSSILPQLWDGLVDNVWGSAEDEERQARLSQAWGAFSADESTDGAHQSTAEQIAAVAVEAHLVSCAVSSAH